MDDTIGLGAWNRTKYTLKEEYNDEERVLWMEI